MTAPEIVIDSDHYPTEDSLAAFEAYRFPDDCREAARWLVEELPQVARKIGNCGCRRFEHPGHVTIRFATGGWSGAEELIAAVLKHRMLRIAFYSCWKRGGLHVFIVPRKFLEEPTP